MSPTVPLPPLAAPSREPSATPYPGVAPLSAPGSDPSPRPTLAERIDALLPQTQCTRCGYPDCRGYADALASGEAQLNQCPPGGAEGVRRLAQLLGRPALALNPVNGDEGLRRIVFIDEATCIGCTLCIQACPVDAIIGGPKRMHAVVEALCTGCELCIPACPVDCIVLADASAGATGWDAWSPAQAEEARARYAAHQARLARDEREHAATTRAAQAPGSLAAPASSARAASDEPAAARSPDAPPVDPKRAAIDAALARARLRAKLQSS